MLTIKHIEDNGHECVMQAISVTYDRGEKKLIAFGSPGPDEGARSGGVVQYGSGIAYVMEGGKTVAKYELN